MPSLALRCSTLRTGIREDNCAELAPAIFEWIERWYNPNRRHTSLGMLSAHD